MELSDHTSKAAALLSHIRYRDALIFLAPCIVALAIFFPALSLSNLARAVQLAFGGFLIMAYIFALNDWADIGLDSENDEKRRHTYSSDGISSRAMLALPAMLAIAGVLTIAVDSKTPALLALVIVLFGLAYSFPVRGRQGKGIPVLSSALHFVGTLLTFLIGATAFVPISLDSVAIGCYFGIIITAGHLTQEVQDYDDDRLAGVRTNAVQFGQNRMFVLSFALFGLSFLYLIWLAQAGLVPPDVKYLVVLYPVYAVWAIRVSQAGLARRDVKKLRNKYAMLFALVVLIVLIEFLFRKVI